MKLEWTRKIKDCLTGVDPRPEPGVAMAENSQLQINSLRRSKDMAKEKLRGSSLVAFLSKNKWRISALLCFAVVAALGLANGSLRKEGVGFFELKKGDLSVKLTNWGASIVSLHVPDKNGNLADIVLGYDSVEEYMNDSTFFGAIVGRVANRIGSAGFTLNGVHYKLVANDGNNTLHGGSKGFSDVVWKVEKYDKNGRIPQIVFSYHSFDGEQGFPADLKVTVSYKLINDDQLSVTMKAEALQKPTPVNLAQHTYWNLGGHNSGDILSNNIQILASKITLVDAHLIPTGEIASVKGTPYDFLEAREIQSKFDELPNGYDINYVLDGGEAEKMKKAAVIVDRKTGRELEVWTNSAGMQFYTGNYIKNVKGKGGFIYKDHAGLCLETQGFPDAVNHPNFPSTIVNPAKPYNHRMLFKFSTQK